MLGQLGFLKEQLNGLINPVIPKCFQDLNIRNKITKTLKEKEILEDGSFFFLTSSAISKYDWNTETKQTKIVNSTTYK